MFARHKRVQFEMDPFKGCVCVKADDQGILEDQFRGKTEIHVYPKNIILINLINKLVLSFCSSCEREQKLMVQQKERVKNQMLKLTLISHS